MHWPCALKPQFTLRDFFSHLFLVTLPCFAPAGLVRYIVPLRQRSPARREGCGALLHCCNCPVCKLASEGELSGVYNGSPSYLGENSCLTLQCTQTKHLLKPRKTSKQRDWLYVGCYLDFLFYLFWNILTSFSAFWTFWKIVGFCL